MYNPEALVTYHAHTAKQDRVVGMDLDCLAVVILSQTDLAHPQIARPEAIPEENKSFETREFGDRVA
jgi:hypothetical protein